MTKPSVDQKAVLREQLNKMVPEQWLAFVRWIAFKLVEDPELTVQVICDEVDRRRIRHEEDNPNSNSRLSTPAALTSVMKDLNLYIGQIRQ